MGEIPLLFFGQLGEVEFVEGGLVIDLFICVPPHRNSLVDLINLEFLQGWLGLFTTFFHVEVVHAVLVFEVEDLSQCLLTE